MGKKGVMCMEIKDFTVMNYCGVNYYALKDICSYLGMTQKNYEEQHGNVYKLYGSKWITVDDFNEVANVITKVVFNTYHKQLSNDKSMSEFAKLLFAKDEHSKRAFEQMDKERPQKAMEKIISMQDENVSNLLQEAQKDVENVRNVVTGFKRGWYDVDVLCYYNGKKLNWYAVGNGVFVEINNWGYDYFYYDETTDVDEDWHDVEFENKIVKWNDETYVEFKPLNIDFTGMNLSECIATCLKYDLMIMDYEFIGTDDTCFEHSMILEMLLGDFTLKRVDVSFLFE